MKEVMEAACGLDLAPGMDAESRSKYTQKFVRAPESLHPQAHPEHMNESFASAHAMKISMGC